MSSGLRAYWRRGSLGFSVKLLGLLGLVCQSGSQSVCLSVRVCLFVHLKSLLSSSLALIRVLLCPGTSSMFFQSHLRRSCYIQLQKIVLTAIALT